MFTTATGEQTRTGPSAFMADASPTEPSFWPSKLQFLSEMWVLAYQATYRSQSWKGGRGILFKNIDLTRAVSKMYREWVTTTTEHKFVTLYCLSLKHFLDLGIFNEVKPHKPTPEIAQKWHQETQVRTIGFSKGHWLQVPEEMCFAKKHRSLWKTQHLKLREGSNCTVKAFEAALKP